MQEHFGFEAVLYAVSITGMISNAWPVERSTWSIFCISPMIENSQYMHNPFGIICTVLALSNFGVMLVFFGWNALPMNILQIYAESPGKVVGQIALFCLYSCEYAHVALSFNRLVHIAFPLQGWRFFTKPVTVVIVLLILLFAFLEVIPYFSPEQCYFVFDPTTALWNFADTECGRFCAQYIDFLISVIVLSTILVMDAIALFLFHQHRLNLACDSDKNRSIEKKLFAQSICQMVPICIAIFANHFIGGNQSSDWGLFLSVTLSWGMLHAVDGLVLVALHSKLLEETISMLTKVWTRQFNKLQPSNSLNIE
ncbi:hypothetical protein PRIPAC_80455 [Pristionchus pacificus]|uniref:G protein-coupled receptor n=1 Tax=Pristionchus pacificus TaxID=54126 RepID=A0A2A6CKB2_PRIPA|nr:hypothetical protein PRIPAC_80455 [Pristionchus pacificus]|eukprot:PDM78517.1 G protein-coupled receptor [Pristionchus pacificus]